MTTASLGDRIDIGNGKVGIIVEVRAANLYVVSWSGGTRSTVVPDHRAHIEPGYFGRLVGEAEAATRAARSQTARRGWATRRAATGT
ncbi:hypothetical protein KGQ20_05465 [Catenulispora sp. NF23]|uniref:DUF1918 domain-containing protein n=1 Tax=Catenulispora pinistramenti TaxID=2705254 RepID=A0ABS5KK13_9ACTN|nr:hypothetical protein [Catenulispora pinistramenti]MBS2532214.1 hypothetical protein [Catenulispora pinistramenti]MBS2546385.1 hypothetical protein [Catenulispora pinistramenti]